MHTCDSWYEPEYSFEEYRRDHILDEFEEKKENCADHFREVLKMLYDEGPLDLIKLEDHLDEMTYYFDSVKMIPGDLKICRSQQKFALIDPEQYKEIYKMSMITTKEYIHLTEKYLEEWKEELGIDFPTFLIYHLASRLIKAENEIKFLRKISSVR